MTAAGVTATDRRWSFEWWFRNRRTGEMTFAQRPNAPLLAMAVAFVVRALTDDGSAPHSIAGAAFLALWFAWAADEVVRGVNPWRRVLGLAGLAALAVVALG